MKFSIKDFFIKCAQIRSFLWICSDRQGSYCNNLATGVIPFFIISKSLADGAISKTVLPHFFNYPLPRYRWRHYLQSPQKLLFETCLNFISSGCSSCTNQFLIKYYGFKMQGKEDITSDTKCYDV